MVQNENLTFKAPTGMKRFRFVTVTIATDTVAYTAENDAPDAITLGDEENGVISVQLLSDTSKSFWFEAAGAIAVGEEVMVSADDGKGIKWVTDDTPPEKVCVAKSVGVDGAIVTGYNL